MQSSEEIAVAGVRVTTRVELGGLLRSQWDGIQATLTRPSAILSHPNGRGPALRRLVVHPKHLAVWRRAGGVFLGLVLGVSSIAAEPDVRALPTPRIEGGRPLLDVLRDRRSVREFASEPLGDRELSDLLWAAFGVNRPESGQRTAPCTMNLRAIDLYVVTSGGAWRFEAEGHRLREVSREDLRPFTGGPESIRSAPVALVLVADEQRMAKVPPAERSFYEAADAGCIAQNVYLFAASEGLGCVVHMPGDRAALARGLQLVDEQKVVLVHSVGRVRR